MSTITKEWLQQKIAEMEEHRDLFPGDLDDDHGKVLAALRVALASLEAEAVACPKCNDTGMTDSGGVYPWGEGIAVPCDCTFPDPELSLLIHNLHIDGNHGLANVIQDLIEGKSKDSKIKNTSPPAPVSVPDEVTTEDCPAFVKYDVTDVDEAWARGFNACRAAMLQGAENAESLHAVKAATLLSSSAKGIELLHADFQSKSDGNSPVIPDGWVACSERMPEVGSTIMVFMDKPQHSATDYAITTFDKYGFSRAKVTHWQPLPAAPRQEVK